MAEMSRVQEVGRFMLNHIRFVVAAVVLIIWVIVGRVIYEPQMWDYGMNVFTEMVGIGVTVLILDELNRRRAKNEAIEELKQQLLDDAASNVNDVASNAVHQLRRKRWLRGEDGLLKGAYLLGANLQGAYLVEANLQGAYLVGANLQDAHLMLANLQGANLWGANLQDAHLMLANLQGAHLMLANLQGADLDGAKLQGADLWQADLQGADLWGAQYDEKTMLPDHTLKKPSLWTPETDMRRFTDPDHPGFWRSDKDWSPAYRGKDEE